MSDRRSKLTQEVGKFLSRFAHFQFWFEVVFVVGGAAVAGIARAADNDPFTYVGIGMSGIGGIAILILKRDVSDLIKQADGALIELNDQRTKEESLAARIGKLQTQLSSESASADRQDTRRRERLRAFDIMLESLEAGFLTGSSPGECAQVMIQQAFDHLRRAIDNGEKGQLSIAIFKAEDERMVRIGAASNSPAWNRPNPRSWVRGTGFTGVCWVNAENNAQYEVIVPDIEKEDIERSYPVPEPDAERDCLYRSAASIPILVGKEDRVWGVVTATSSVAEIFKRDRNNLRVQNVDTIRDVARCASMLAFLAD